MSSCIKNLQLRARIIQTIRSFFDLKGFLEVETPLRIPANAPEEYIDPFCSDGQYLQTSPELCMKRLLCKGFDKIFQICPCWRNGERGNKHIPEFTMLEWYRSHSNYKDLMKDCEELLLYISKTCYRANTVSYQSNIIVLDELYTRISVKDAFDLYTDTKMEDAIKNRNFDEVMVTQIEPALFQKKPVLLLDYPIEMASLARPNTENPLIAERFELYAGGLELANGFSELNDPVEQRLRFMKVNENRIKNGLPDLPIPEPFLRELALMPPSAGIALGVDRLVMLFTGVTNIDDIISFTPEHL